MHSGMMYCIDVEKRRLFPCDHDHVFYILYRMFFVRKRVIMKWAFSIDVCIAVGALEGTKRQVGDFSMEREFSWLKEGEEVVRARSVCVLVLFCFAPLAWRRMGISFSSQRLKGSEKYSPSPENKKGILQSDLSGIHGGKPCRIFVESSESSDVESTHQRCAGASS